MKFHASDPDIQTIVARIGSGDIDLQPDFQRGEVWTTRKKQKLIDSILRDWHVPPIHVVVDAHGRQVVLDGQQRLVSIRDFVNGSLKVDGTIEPHDPEIVRLDGLTYSNLPSGTRRSFDQFTVRIFRLTDYSPEEPGELFFRLNQMTYLTAAEQRNAFFGPVRQQIKDLVNRLDEYDWSNVIGFTNRRMAYDDVLAKFLCTLEAGTLAKKITATDISSRFRAERPFDNQFMRTALDCVQLMDGILHGTQGSLRFNKATLFSWLMFLHYFVGDGPKSERLSRLQSFSDWFEQKRSEAASGSRVFFPGNKSLGDNEWSLLLTYVDRSSSRVSDISSVVLRDLILWIFFAVQSGAQSDRLHNLPLRKRTIIKDAIKKLRMKEFAAPSVMLEQSMDIHAWGALQ